tara:strand:- start:28593 stop:28916 length:324 start_codon:yes stop_codon:yes gene_type:complete
METSPNNQKILAIVTYITLIGWIIAFMVNSTKKNPLVTYHQRQALGIQLLYFGISVLITITGLVALQVLFFGVLIFIIIGITNASKEQEKPLPILGEYFEDWFKGIG